MRSPKPAVSSRGTVTDDRTHAPVAGIAVVAKSPSATYRTATDSQGRYRFLSMLPDNYSLSFTHTGFAPFSTIVVVINGSQQSVNVSLSTSLKTIATTRARSAGSAFQHGMTIDTYTVTGNQITMVQGKEFNTDQTQLLRSIPSVTIDKSGTVSIRGGFAFEAAYEFEGIDYTTPNANLQNTLQNVGNFNLLNGVGTVQLIPGGGDATHGNTGTGLRALHRQARHLSAVRARRHRSAGIPVSASVGTRMGLGRPQTATFELRRLHRRAQKLSVRHSGYGGQHAGNAGHQCRDARERHRSESGVLRAAVLSTNDFVDNLIYRFGKNQGQRLQFFMQDQQITQKLDYGGFAFLPYISGGTTRPESVRGTR